ncbi:MAG TPA: PP2C family protein-serine/threonine phosphatase [Leptospiraceae bacterium]|jgi:serine phosphatase RsbU (regulator of sigma subunit)|nr:serine/threonine-protein phosphatase [Leptospirales bacterium]HMU82709.1 PP2C family protein-serine/threonine phosphatase [Leptospiraceae bacterium]HMW60022.1 PP2C family protein-serine/threonine phosphatase [Leptospiraceae bacterium]HMX58451.1 PP2C family protein-serine/threonine phosphatase [Leptospiraceae bacterium]HMY43918.1 PP2C family protein-serine/threonine phosphatase [Leptospiraceae bacterium]
MRTSLRILRFLRRYSTAFLHPDHPFLRDYQERRRLQIIMVTGGLLGVFMLIRGILVIRDTPEIGGIVLTLAFLIFAGMSLIVALRAKGYRWIALALVTVAGGANYANSYLSRVFPPAGLPFAAAVVVALHFLFNRWMSLLGLVVQIVAFLPFLYQQDFHYASEGERQFWHTRFFANSAVSLGIIWILCEAYRSVRDQAEIRLNRLKAELARDITLAGKIQKDLLPPNKSEGGPYQWHGFMRTMSGAGAGGDYIDALEIRGHTWFAMGDVTGHGIQAGLLVMLARTSLHQVLRDQQVQDPGKVLSLLDYSFSRTASSLTEKSFMTFVLMRFDANGKVTFAGSHLKILVYRPAEDRMDILETKGPWIGVLTADRRVSFDEFTFQLGIGDIVLLYTDGITEARDALGEAIEVKGLLNMFREALQESQDIEKINHRIIDLLVHATGKNIFDDDLSLLTIRRAH